jgi:hypothetical protein
VRTKAHNIFATPYLFENNLVTLLWSSPLRLQYVDGCLIHEINYIYKFPGCFEWQKFEEKSTVAGGTYIWYQSETYMRTG